MTTPPQPPEPPTTPPPPAGYGAPPPPPAAGVPGGQPQKSSLPLISLILGLLSIFCFGFLTGIAAIITGVVGRKKAQENGQGAGMALAGIITGAIGSLISIIAIFVLVVFGATIFGAVSEQVEVAEELKPASLAAQAYGLQNGTYAGISTSALSTYGFTPASDVIVTAVPLAGGAAYCIEGAPVGDPGNKIHVPASGGNSVELSINGVTYNYSVGGCPPAS